MLFSLLIRCTVEETIVILMEIIENRAFARKTFVAVLLLAPKPKWQSLAVKDQSK